MMTDQERHEALCKAIAERSAKCERQMLCSAISPDQTTAAGVALIGPDCILFTFAVVEPFVPFDSVLN